MKDGVANHPARFLHCKYRRIFPQRALPEEGFRLFFVKRQVTGRCTQQNYIDSFDTAAFFRNGKSIQCFNSS